MSGVNTEARFFVLKTEWMFRHEKVLPIGKVLSEIAGTATRLFFMLYVRLSDSERFITSGLAQT
jgi:hypothetical protein